MYMSTDKPKRRKPRNRHIKVLVNTDEKRKLEADAADAAVSASAWLRTGRLPEEVK